MRKSINIGSDCSGVGALLQALQRLRIDYTETFSCDFDYFARLTYLHNYGTREDIELGNSKEHKVFADSVKKIALSESAPSEDEIAFLDEANEFAKKFSFYYPFNMYQREVPRQSCDLYVSSVPCQAFSLAGKRKGEGDKRGILFYNSHEFIQKNRPRYFIFENVKGLLSDDAGRTFGKWCDYLGGKSVNGNPVIFPHEESVPYHIYHRVLNAKDFGVPQHRERVFVVGIRDDGDNDFTWPKPFPLEKRLKDVLEEEVDEKYFLSDEVVSKIITDNINTDHLFPKDVSNTIRVGGGGSLTEKHAFDMIKVVGNVNPSGNGMNGNVFDEQGISPSLTTNKGEGIKIKSATKKGYEIATEGDSINFSVPNSETRRGRVGKSVAQTLDTQCNQGVMIGAMCGRNPENPSDRTTGAPTEQKLEVNKNGTSNTITSVQKDNLVILHTNPVVEYQLTGGKWDKTHEQSGRVYDKNGVAPIIHTMGGGNQEPKIFHNQVLQLNPSKESGGKQPYQQNRIYEKNGLCPALNAGQEVWGGNLVNTHRIRRLTPRECFRLMDFDESFTWPVSDSQAYKQAGNSIVVEVLAQLISRLKLGKSPCE